MIIFNPAAVEVEVEEELEIERDRRQRRQRRDSQQPSVWNCATFLRLTSVVPSREEFACSAATMIGGQCDAQSHALVIGKSLVCTSVKQEEF